MRARSSWVLAAAIAFGCDSCGGTSERPRAVDNKWSESGVLLGLGGENGVETVRGSLVIDRTLDQDRLTKTASTSLPPSWRRALARAPHPGEPRAMFVGKLGDLWMWEEIGAFNAEIRGARIIYTVRASKPVRVDSIVYRIETPHAVWALDGVEKRPSGRSVRRVTWQNDQGTWEVRPMRPIDVEVVSAGTGAKIELVLSPARSFVEDESWTFALRIRRNFVRDEMQPAAEKMLDGIFAATASAAEAAHARMDHRALRARLIDDLGLQPSTGELNPQVERRFERDGYRVEHVSFESRPGFRVTAIACVPTSGSGPWPAVLESTGHYAEGKAEPDTQRRCAMLARLGFVVLTIDTFGTGERNGPGFTHGWGADLLAIGETVAGIAVGDAIRALDYLSSRRDVDPKRIGMTGISGGGLISALTAAIDDRVAAVAPASYVSNIAELYSSRLGYCDCNYIPNFARDADWGDVIGAIAPRPVLLLAAEQDLEIPVQGVWGAYFQARPVFASVPDKLGVVTAPGEHLYSLELREALYRFMVAHLRPQPGPPPVETRIELASRADLESREPITTTTVESLIFDTPPQTSPQPAKGSRELLARSLGIAEAARRVGELSIDPRAIDSETTRFFTADGISLAGRSQLDPSKTGVGIVIDPEGLSSGFIGNGAKHLAAINAGVFVLEVRATGATRTTWRHRTFLTGATIASGAPLVGLRVAELEAAIRYLRTAGRQQGPIVLLARGPELGVAAVLTAALGREKVSAVFAPDLPRSRSELLNMSRDLLGGATSFRLLASGDVSAWIEMAGVPVESRISELPALLARVIRKP